MMKSIVTVCMTLSFRVGARSPSDAGLGEDRVDLAHRLAHALLHAHLDHLLELLGRLEGGHARHPGAAVHLLEGHDSPAAPEVAGRLTLVVGEAVLEFETPRLVEIGDPPPAPRLGAVRAGHVVARRPAG